MANPQPTDAHLRIAHSILEQVMVSDFTKRQLSILLFILRLSWGCGKKEALIPRQNDFEIVGVGSGHIKTELDWLSESKVIYRNGNIYSFNKNYDEWRVSRAKGYHQEKLTEMVKLNLQNGKTEITKRVTKSEKKLPKGEKPDYQNGKNSTSKLASPKERGGGEGRGTPPIKESIKEIYIVLFNLWNSLKVSTHKKLTGDMRRAIDNARKDYTQEEIGRAMQNYALIVKGSEYYFNYRWTLVEFLSRRHSNNIERFLDLEVAKGNFRKEAKSGANRQSSRQLTPRESYTRPEDA